METQLQNSSTPIQIKVEPLSPSQFEHDLPDEPLNLAQSTPMTKPMENQNGHSTYPGIQNVTGALNGSTSLTMPFNSDMSSYNRNGDLQITNPYAANSVYSMASQNSSNMYMTDKQTGNASILFGGYGYDLHANGVDMLDNGETDVSFQTPGKNASKPPSKRSNLPKRYKCAMCAYRTRYKSDLNRHVRKHAVATFNCEICNMPFKTVGNVEFHKRKEHANLLESSGVDALKYKCTHCTYGTMYSSDLTRHVRKHYMAKFHCTTCNRPFMTSGSLVHHKRTVHDLNDVEVVMGSDGLESVNQSEITTLREEDAEMDTVDKASSGKDDNSRMEIENGANSTADLENDANGQKNTVEKSSNEKMELSLNTGVEDDGNVTKEQESQNSDSEKITYTYEEPDKETEITVTIDRSENEVISKYTCPYCEKSFGRKMVLEYHLRNIHKMKNGGNGMFVEYPDDYELALDMSIQELENSTSDATPSHSSLSGAYSRPRHQCPFCAYATNYKSTYDRHVKKHDLECHICNVCRMPFITFGHLQRHIRDNHPDHVQAISKKEVTVDKQKCSFCPFEADSLPSLQVHCESEHNKLVGISPQQPQQKKVTSPTKNQSHKAASGKHSKQTIQEDSAEDELEFGSKTMLSWKHQRTNPQLEDGVAMHPPSSGRYAKLVSDFDDFSLRPFACSLCFYRTGSIELLIKHAENHLTGCNSEPIPDTARFPSHLLDQVVNVPYQGLVQQLYSPSQGDLNQICDGQVYNQVGKTFSQSDQLINKSGQIATNQSTHVYKQHYQVKQSNSGTKLTLKSIPSDELQIKEENCINKNISKQTSGNLMAKALQGNQAAVLESEMNKKLDKVIPTFSVHYRKDKTNKTRPYLCLLCRKRFRHLTLLKQHFKQCHSDSQINSSRTYTCNICKKVFNNPMVLQNHYDVNH